MRQVISTYIGALKKDWPTSPAIIRFQQPPDALIHFPLHKIAAILAGDIFKCIFLNEND